MANVLSRDVRFAIGVLATCGCHGPLAGTTKLTDNAGRFELTGTAAGAVTLRASREGFQTRTQALSWPPPTSAAPVYVAFWLDTLEPPIGLDPGDYTLTLAIDLPTASNWGTRAPCAGFPSSSRRAAIGRRSRRCLRRRQFTTAL